MTIKVKSPPSAAPMLKNTAAAPVIYFDNVPAYGMLAGNLEIEIAARVLLPKADGGVSSDMLCVAHLRCSPQAALLLRESLDRALSMIAPESKDGRDEERSPLLNS